MARRRMRAWRALAALAAGLGMALAMAPPLAGAADPLTVGPDPYPLNFHRGDPATEVAAWGNCTWWAWNLWWQNFHLWLPGLLGNGGQWGQSLAAAGYTTLTPAQALATGVNPVGALAWWDPTAQDPAGHVGVVIGYDANRRQILVSYSNWDGADGANWGIRTLLPVDGIMVDDWTSWYPLDGAGAPSGLVLPPPSVQGHGLLRTVSVNGQTAQALLLGTDPLPRRWQLVPAQPWQWTTVWQNIGQAAWPAGTAVRVQLAGSSWLVALAQPVAPGQTVQVRLTGVAPAAPGVYPLTARLLVAGRQVGPSASADLYVSQDQAMVANPPTVSADGTTAAVTVTMANTGTTTWVGKASAAPYGAAGSGRATFAAPQQYGLLRLSGPPDLNYGDFVPLTEGVAWPSVDIGLNNTATFALTLPLGSQATTAVWQMVDRYPTASGGYATVPMGAPLDVALPAAVASNRQVIAGPDRVATALALAHAMYPQGPAGASVVLVAGGSAHLIDGLAAAPLAHLLQAPLLVAAVEDGAVDPRVLAYLARHRIRTVYLVGSLGNPANAPAVEEALAAADPGVQVVTGLTGQSRYGTSDRVAAMVERLGGSHRLFVAPGDDSLAGVALLAGAAAAAQGSPLALVSAGRGVPSELLAGVRQTVVVGPADAWASTADLPGRQAVGSGIDDLPALSQALALSFFPGARDALVVSASPAHWVDALAAGPLAAAIPAPILMVDRNDGSAAAAWLASHPGARAWVVGWAATYSGW